MSDRTIRIATIVVLGGLYVGLLGYSVLGYGGQPDSQSGASEATRTVPPRVVHHDSDVDVYGSRSVRSGTQRGGGVRGGK